MAFNLMDLPGEAFPLTKHLRGPPRDFGGNMASWDGRDGSWGHGEMLPHLYKCPGIEQGRIYQITARFFGSIHIFDPGLMLNAS